MRVFLNAKLVSTLIILGFVVLFAAQQAYFQQFSILGNFHVSVVKHSFRTQVLSAEDNFLKDHFSANKNYLEHPEKEFDYKTLLITYLATEVHVPVGNIGYIFTFTTMIYSSWKYVLESYPWAKDPGVGVKLDLLVYYSEGLDSNKLPVDCLELFEVSQLTVSKQSRCFKRRITERVFPYAMLNQFIFLQDPQFEKMIAGYNYISKTDPDTFITPAFFSWKLRPSVEIVIGNQTPQIL